MRRGWARFPSFASAFLLGSIGATLAAPWPLRDRQTVTTSVDGEVLATFEFKTEGGANYMHEGIDIAAVPKSKDPNAPVVIAVVDGTVVDVKNVANSYDNYVKVEGTDGNCYLYLHLDGITVGTGASVSAGKPLGDVFAWPWCTTNYDHLHLEISKPGDACVPDSGVFTSALIAPLTQLESVANDDSPPVVEDIAVCTDGGDCDGLGVAGCDPTPATCLDVTKGRLDIVAEIQDLYGTRFVRTAGDPIAPETIEWRACSEAAPDCDPWNPFLDLKTMDPLWIDRSLQKAVGPLFDNLGSCVSSGAYCADSQSCPPAADFCSKTGERFRYIVTNVDGSGKPSSSGSWDTSTLASGHYTVAVAAVDYEGNRGARSVPVCLHDPESCLAKLTVRDCEGDNGAEPSACDLGWLSPDIIENPDAAGNPGSAVVAGSANTVRVCATNTGCAPIPGDDHVSFALDWAITTASVPYPVGTIGGVAVPDTPGLTVKDLTKRDGSAPASTDWPVGEERCTDLKWTPSAGGHVCLVVRVAHGSDAPTPGPAAALDNNRAQHNLVLTDAVAVSPTTWLSLVAIHLGPLPPKRARSVVLQVDPDRAAGGHGVRVQLVTEASLGRVVGGRVAGYLPREALTRWERRKPLIVCDRAGPDDGPCIAANRVSPSDATIVEIDPPSTEVVLSDVVVARQPASFDLFAQWESLEQRQKPLEIRVRERIASAHGTGTVELGGLTIRFSERRGASTP